MVDNIRKTLYICQPKGIPMNKIIPQKLKIARKMRGYSMEKLSKQMQGMVSKQSISKYEQGRMQPSDEVLSALSKVLNLPLTYFFKQGVKIGEINFRKDLRLSAKSIEQLVGLAHDKIEHYLDIEEILNISYQAPNPIQHLIIRSVEDVEMAAKQIRLQLQLGESPIFSVYDMLESKGVKLLEFESGCEAVMGFSCWVNDTIPLVVINLSTNHTTERKRFTAIHELGHLFLRFSDEIDEDMRERFCNYFAGAVLCPSGIIRKELGESRKLLTLDELISLRNRYGISVAAAVHRAKDLGIISDSYYNDIFNHHIHLNRMEEGWGRYPIEEHTDRFERLVHRCVAEGYMSVNEAAHYVKEKPKEYKRKLTLLL